MARHAAGAMGNPAGDEHLAWLWLFDPSYSAFNYTLAFFGVGPIPGPANVGALLGHPQHLGRRTVLHDHVSGGAEIGADQLYEAAAIDGANWWQRIWYVTLPMMRNIIAITTLFSLIVTFANFDIVRILTAGGPLDHTHIFATWAFRIGIEGSDIPLGASVSLYGADPGGRSDLHPARHQQTRE